MRKLLSITLALVLFMLSSVYAFAEEFTPADSYDTGERAFTGRPVTTVLKEGESGGTVSTDIFQNEEGLDYTDEAVYTYNSYMAEIVNLDWNPHTWETSDEAIVTVADGVVTAVSTGNALITAIDENGKQEAWIVAVA